MFTDWHNAIRNYDWDTCDMLATLLLHTLPQGHEQRQTLQTQMTQIQRQYEHENILLQQILLRERNPFKKEELKMTKKLELDYWRARELHNLFMQRFMKDSLINKDK